MLIRGLLAVMVGGVWGQTTPHFPLYIVEALLVEAVFARAGGRSPGGRSARSPASLIGTIGLAAEWGWSHVWMPHALAGVAAARGRDRRLRHRGGGGRRGRLRRAARWRGREARLPEPRSRAERLTGRRWPALLVLVAVIAWGLPISSDGPERARASRSPTCPASDGRDVHATVRVSPPDALDGRRTSLNVTAWQGGGSVVSELERVGPGVYRTTEPVPVHGGWKSMVRVHTGDALVAVPIYLPRDRAIPAPEVPAQASFTRGRSCATARSSSASARTACPACSR